MTNIRPQTAKQSAEDAAHFCHFCQALEQISSKLPAGFAYSKRLGKGHYFPTKKNQQQVGSQPFFFWGGVWFGEGVSINFWQKSWMISFLLVGVVDFGPGYLTSNPGNLGTALRVCPAHLTFWTAWITWMLRWRLHVDTSRSRLAQVLVIFFFENNLFKFWAFFLNEDVEIWYNGSIIELWLYITYRVILLQYWYY